MVIKNHLEKTIRNKILIEKGILDNKKDILIEKDLIKTQVNYILSTKSKVYNKTICKYNLANYYYLLARRFNSIALQRKVSRNTLWLNVKENILFKSFSKTELRCYNLFLRGEIIPCPRLVVNVINKYEELPTYMSIIYLDEHISPELNDAYKKLVGTRSQYV